MKQFIRYLILLTLLVITAIFTAYSLNKDYIFEEITLRASSGLSYALKREVEIKDLDSMSFGSATFSDITVHSPSGVESSEIHISKIKVSANPLSILLNKQLAAIINITDLSLENTHCDMELKIVSRKSGTYEKILDPALLDAIYLLDGTIENDHMSISDIFGIAEVDGLEFSELKTRLSYKDQRYFITFMPSVTLYNGYSLILRSKHLGFRTAFVMQDNTAAIDSLQGMFYTLNFDMKGEVSDPLTEERTVSLNGSVEANLDSLKLLPGKCGKFAKKNKLRGSIQANTYLKASGLKPEDIEISLSAGGNLLEVNDFVIDEFNGKFALKEGRLTSHLVNFYVYNGNIACELIADLLEEGYPYMLSARVNNINYGSLIYDISKGTENVYGTLSADVNLKGYANNTSTAEGEASVIITEADLGPMPVLTPLLGDLYAGLEAVFPDPHPVTINEARADLRIKDLKISSSNIEFIGDGITIKGKGYMDFDGKLNFLFQNRFTPEVYKQEDNWQDKLRDAFINLGKKMGSAHLRGTIYEPIWDFKFGEQ